MITTRVDGSVLAGAGARLRAEGEECRGRAPALAGAFGRMGAATADAATSATAQATGERWRQAGQRLGDGLVGLGTALEAAAMAYDAAEASATSAFRSA